MSRVDPFGNLDEFTPKTSPKPPLAREKIDQLAEEHGFPSRGPQVAPAGQPVRRARGPRQTTGRNQQINIKATGETIARLTQMSNAMDGAPYGEVLERALAALEKELARAGRDDK